MEELQEKIDYLTIQLENSNLKMRLVSIDYVGKEPLPGYEKEFNKHKNQIFWFKKWINQLRDRMEKLK